MRSGILTVASGLTSALSQGNNTQKLGGGCGLAGDRHRSTTCGDAVCAWIAVAEGPQLMCRFAPGEVQHRTVHCWHNRPAACGDSGLLYAVGYAVLYDCGVARGCCGLDALDSCAVWNICEKSLCFSAFSNRQKYLGRNSRSEFSILFFSTT